MSSQTQFKQNYLRDSVYVIMKQVILELIFLQFNLFAFELENGVAMSPKRCSLLSLIFTCLRFAKPLLISVLRLTTTMLTHWATTPPSANGN